MPRSKSSDKSSRGEVITRPRTKLGRAKRTEAQEVMRERIKGQQHLNHIVKNIKRLENLKEELDPTQVNRLKIATDHHFKILGKILPDIKATEINVTGSIDHKRVDELSTDDLKRIIDAEYTEIKDDQEEA